jgi:hypothetical protein
LELSEKKIKNQQDNIVYSVQARLFFFIFYEAKARIFFQLWVARLFILFTKTAEYNLNTIRTPLVGKKTLNLSIRLVSSENKIGFTVPPKDNQFRNVLFRHTYFSALSMNVVNMTSKNVDAFAASFPT